MDLKIAILTVYKQANHRTEFFVLTANKPLVDTLMAISDVMVSIAITFVVFTVDIEM